MYWLDMPNPLLWGLIAFVLNFVPYAGSATTLVLLTVVALVSFDGVGKAVTVAGTYLRADDAGRTGAAAGAGRPPARYQPAGGAARALVRRLALGRRGRRAGDAGAGVGQGGGAGNRAQPQRRTIEPDAETVRTRASHWLRERARAIDGSRGRGSAGTD